MTCRIRRSLCVPLLLSGVLLLTGAASPEEQKVQQSSAHYRQYHDAASLRIAASQLVKGLAKSKVVALFGAPDYSRSDAVDDQGRSLVLVVDYHRSDGVVGETVGWFFLDFIGELSQ